MLFVFFFCLNQGDYSISQSILAHCKEIYSTNIKTSQHWMYAENSIAIEKNLLAGKWSLSRFHIQRLASTNFQQALL